MGLMPSAKKRIELVAINPSLIKTNIMETSKKRKLE